MSASNSPCAACKFLRRKCVEECLFAAYFPPDQPQKFSNVHKVYGASNVGKILNELPPEQRYDAVNSLAYEAEMRLQDPVYGCVGMISALQQQLNQVHGALFFAKRELANYMNPNALPPLNPDFFNQHGSSAVVLDLQRNYNMGPFSPAGPSNVVGPCLIAPSHDVIGPSRGDVCGSKLVIREPQQQPQFMRFHGRSYEDSIVVDDAGGFNDVGPTSAAAALPTLALEATPFDLTEYDHHRVQAHHHRQQQHQDDESLGQFSLLQRPQQQLIIGLGQSSQEIPYHEHNNHQ